MGNPTKKIIKNNKKGGKNPIRKRPWTKSELRREIGFVFKALEERRSNGASVMLVLRDLK